MTKKVFCYSWWGKNNKGSEFYSYGLLDNALIAKELFPDWILRIYYEENNVDEKILNALSTFDNVELIKFAYNGDDNDNSKMFVRFSCMFEEDNIIYVCQDADSRLDYRGKAVIDDWLASDKDFMIVRDHFYHNTVILGGFFGARNNVCRPLVDQFYSYTRHAHKGDDQNFLAQVVYPHVVNNSMIYASFNKFEGQMCKDFPAHEPNKYSSFCCAYVRTAPLAFKYLGEPERLLETLYEYQKM